MGRAGWAVWFFEYDVMRSKRPTVALTLGMRRHWWVARKDLILLPPSKTIPKSKLWPESL